MAETSPRPQSMDPQNGFCPQTKTFHSLRPSVPLPPLSQPLSITDYTFSLLHSNTNAATLSTTTFLIDSTTNQRLSYSTFLHQTQSLSSSLLSHFPSLSKGHVAFILSPPSLHIPVLYFSLLSLGLTISPANPLSTRSELTHLVQLTKPIIAFCHSSLSHKLPSFPLPTIFLDSDEFVSLMTSPTGSIRSDDSVRGVEVYQSDMAAILYSSGTTGRIKGVELTHRNIISMIAGLYHNRYDTIGEIVGDSSSTENNYPMVSLFTLPLFHVFGFFMMVRAAALGEALVLMEKFDFEKMLMAIEKYRVTYMPVSPPLVVAMAKSDLVEKYDVSSLQLLGCGGAPLGKEVSEQFKARFPNVFIAQFVFFENAYKRARKNSLADYRNPLKFLAKSSHLISLTKTNGTSSFQRYPRKDDHLQREGYGLTETGGAATRMMGQDEYKLYGSAGRLVENMEAKIVDPVTGEALSPGQRGEIWLRGPMVMKGYVGDDKATAATIDSEGWLKTGDLGYFDSDGFVFIVDRLKELIKYKAYQVPPAELEHLLQSVPEIADAAVIPYPDEEAGQIPMAYIVRKPGSNITEAQIMEFIGKQVAPYKKIRRVAFVNSIPKSPSGKILRRELVSHALSSASARL